MGYTSVDKIMVERIYTETCRFYRVTIFDSECGTLQKEFTGLDAADKAFEYAKLRMLTLSM